MGLQKQNNKEETFCNDSTCNPTNILYIFTCKITFMPKKPIHKTAVLIFANSGKEEVGRKAITHAETLFEKLTKHTIATVEQASLPYFHISEENQIGTNFGERFVNALDKVFGKGYQNVIAIGNDTPQLEHLDILNAKEKCEKGNLVIGPSVDGGFYLLAIDKEKYSSLPLQRIAWQTNKVASEVQRLSTLKNISVELLNTYTDIDSVSDIKYLIDLQLVEDKILILLLGIITAQPQIDAVEEHFFTTLFQNTHLSRGSPKSFLS
mgnify:CR=1 FL=1